MEKPSQQNLKNTNLQNMVYNGMTQIGYEKTHTDYSFDTDQSDVSLYMTAIASFSHLVKKPSIKVFPDTGLAVTLSCSRAIGTPPTTLSPTLLDINWRCEKTRDDPYEVQITIPVEGYDPIQFTLTKMCGSTQNKGGSSTEDGSKTLNEGGWCFGQSKKRQIKDTMNLVIKKRKEYEEKMKEKGEAPVMFRRSAEEEERAKNLKLVDSVYYHPQWNPTGAPPPGKPSMYKSSIS